MLDKLKPGWEVYKCQQSLESISMNELSALLEESEYQTSFISRQWSVALFVLMMMVTCCYGG